MNQRFSAFQHAAICPVPDVHFWFSFQTMALPCALWFVLNPVYLRDQFAVIVLVDAVQMWYRNRFVVASLRVCVFVTCHEGRLLTTSQ